MEADSPMGFAMPATKEAKPVAETPPEDSFWKRYSPHHEFTVAGAASVFLHGSVVVAMVVTGLGLLWSSASEKQRPVSMGMVMLAPGDTGFEGGGGETGLPGPMNPSRTETALNPMDPPEIGFTPKANDSFTPTPVLEVPAVGAEEKITDDPLAELLKSAKATEAQIAAAKAQAEKNAKAGNTTGGTGNPKGTGGQGGGGVGVGKGSKTGPGVGTGGLAGGRKKTLSEVRADRWRFNLSGDPVKHGEKLVHMGVVIAVPQGRDDYLVARDLKRRPVEFAKEDLAPYKNAVKWENSSAASLQGLARELQMPAAPAKILLLLPKDREEAMAEAEANFAKTQRRSLAAVQETWFDFRLRNGVYEPFVISQK